MCIEIKGCSVKNGKFWGKSQSITHSSQICNHIYVQSNQPKINSRISKNLISTRTNKLRTMFFNSIKICYYCSNNQLFSVWKLWDSKYIFYLLVLGCCFLVWDGNLFGILYFSELWRATWEIWLEAKCWFCPGWEPGRLTNPIQNCKGGLHCKKVL